MTDTCIENLRIRDFLMRIVGYTGHRPPVFERPLESGPAEEAGVTGFLIPVSATLTLALFSIPGISDEKIISDIFAHARSARVNAVILFLSDQGEFYYEGEKTGDQEWIRDLCRKYPKWQEPECQKVSTRSPNPCKGLIRYLSDIRKELNGWFYRREGETSVTLRDLTVQMIIHQVLLTRISRAHGMIQEIRSEKDLWDELCFYATSVPVHDQYDIRVPGADNDEIDQIVQRLVSEPSSELNGIRLSWVEPGTWTEVFGRHLTTLAKKHHKRAGSLVQPHQRAPILPGNTPVGRIITEALADEVDRFIPGRVYDPAAGSGQMIALVLRIIRMQSFSSGRVDSIISRLISAGDTIHASDASAIHIAIVRFSIVIWIISGELRDPCLTKNPLWYPVMALTDHIRAGSILFGADLPYEYISPQAGYQVIRHLHPLDPADLNPEGKLFDLILTCPDGIIPSSVPEIASYLTKRYQSFQKEVSPAALMCERIRDLIIPYGAGIVLTPSCWLSEAAFLGFRRWMRYALPVSVVLEDESAGRIDLKELSAIVHRIGDEPLLRVIRLHKGDDQCLSREYSVHTGDLPDNDGWRLDDPWEEKLLKDLSDDTMPLAGYLFDEIYPGDSRKGVGSPDGWTSIFCSAGGIMVLHSDVSHPDATSIIP
ncbi:MAG: hypothetical protein CVV33_02365, partial [Methanomicrobiales archaeon HGW-Methanomicrobiales-4]